MGRYHYGGQAVIEGVMMRGRHSMAVAVRDVSDRVILHFEPIHRAFARGPLARWPLVRGMLLLADMLLLGMRALTFSAQVAAGSRPAREAIELPRGRALWAPLALSLGLAVGLFFLLPLLIVLLLDRFIPSALVSNLLEGAIRLGLLVGYLLLIGRLPEIERVFAYHGAEHKTINAFEAGAELVPATVRRFDIAHPRCGTGFLLVVVLVSTLVFALLDRPPLPLRLASRVLLVPVIAGISYEYVRLTADYFGHRLVRWLAAPSLALQRLTTREPDDAMLEVAITALQHVLSSEQELARSVAPRSEPAPDERSRPTSLSMPDV